MSKVSLSRTNSSVPDQLQSPRTTTDLVRRATRGDTAALEALLVSAQELTWRFSMSVCGHPEDAEDAMQETLIRTYRHVGQIRDAEAFRPWIYRTVRNVCLMSRRKRVDEPQRVESLDLTSPHADPRQQHMASGAPTPEDAVRHDRVKAHLNRAMEALPPAFRAVVFLRDVEGLSTRETAKTLGISEDNVKARLSRARAVLRRELQSAAEALGGPVAPVVHRRAVRHAKGLVTRGPNRKERT